MKKEYVPNPYITKEMYNKMCDIMKSNEDEYDAKFGENIKISFKNGNQMVFKKDENLEVINGRINELKSFDISDTLFRQLNSIAEDNELGDDE